MNMPTVCIIGAGCSGFTTAKRLQDYGIPFEMFEASDNIGGNWYYDNPNGMSACYKSLHIDTSKWRLAFEDYPVPDHWPDYPHHAQLQPLGGNPLPDGRQSLAMGQAAQRPVKPVGKGWSEPQHHLGRVVPFGGCTARHQAYASIAAG